jgi:hypothetical protein
MPFSEPSYTTDAINTMASGRRTSRPSVPEWAGELTLEDDLSGAEDPSEVGNASNTHVPNFMASMAASSNEEADSGSAQALVALEKHLSPSPHASGEELQGWLAEKLLTCGDEDVLIFWCEHWARRMEEMPDYESQLLTRSLFLDSIRRLQSLSNSTHAASTDALMLLDIEDGSDRSNAHADPTLVSRIQRLEKMPAYKPLLDAKAQLFELACGTDGRALLEAAFDGQMYFFQELIQDDNFEQYQGDVVDLDTARIKILLRAVADTDVEEAPTANPSDGPAFDLSSISALKLSRWQMRALAVSGSQAVLTAWQAHTHRSRGQAVGTEPVDLSHYGLAPVAEITDGHGGMSSEGH